LLDALHHDSRGTVHASIDHFGHYYV
jgi:hypothetical protein